MVLTAACQFNLSSCAQLPGNPWSRESSWQCYKFVGFTGLDCLGEEQGRNGESSSEMSGCSEMGSWPS